MPAVPPVTSRVTIDGKFFRLGDRKFYLKGVTYGPFAPNPAGEWLPPPAQVEADFRQLRELGANVLRLYHVPPRWFLELAAQHELKLFIDVPWGKHTCFLDEAPAQAEARAAVRAAADACAGHPAVFAVSVVNEIPPDVVRWSGAKAVAAFIDELVQLVKERDPECLCTFGNFPSSESLGPRSIDFHCFNVYLHQPRPFENYLARLQMIADVKPLVLGEFGLDTIREGEAIQAETLRWQVEAAFRGGVAGVVIFAFTDDWWKVEGPITDWAFGLTTRARAPKPAFAAVQAAFRAAPYLPPERCPLVSVVVACYNGARTLRTCLASLRQLNYAAYEVILVDDGSTDSTPEIAAQFPTVRYVRQENHGLSVARNTGIKTARGEIIAFTDADCRADPDWLHYLVADLLNSRFAGIGGHNFLPPDDSWVAAAVMAAPGGPAHVMLNDRVAEHIPGCNMAFYRWALLEIGGFDPQFRKAGDDVDVCWRLQQRGYRIGFCPAGFVWHYRRSTVPDYLKQQGGYGEAEALLVRKHPEYFNSIGGTIWQGRIYSTSKLGVIFRRDMIYHGLFGSGFFQSLYAGQPAGALAFFTSLEYQVLVVTPLLVLSVAVRVLTPLAVTSVLIPAIVCIIAAAQAELPARKQRFWSRPLVGLMFFLQPLVRGAARYQGRLSLRTTPLAASRRLDFLNLKYQGQRFDEVHYWTERGVDRLAFITRVLEQLDKQDWPNKSDAGWSNHDVEIFGNRWSRLQLTTVTEYHAGNRQLIRCRLRTAWSLPAHIVFWGALACELLVIGFIAPLLPWLWLLLLTMPAVAWIITQQQRDLQRLIAVFLDEVAAEMELQKVNGATASAAPEKTAAPDAVPADLPSKS